MHSCCGPAAVPSQLVSEAQEEQTHVYTQTTPFLIVFFPPVSLFSFSRHPAPHDILSLDPFLKKLQESCGFRVTRTLLFPLAVVWWLSIIPSL